MVRVEIVVALLLLPLYCAAGTYYVATNGNDGGTGAVDDPWLTVQHAADEVVSGDVVSVGNGTYGERVFTKSDGTQAAPIRFKGASTNASLRGFAVTNHWIVLERLTFSGVSVPDYYGAVTLSVPATNCVVTNCVFASMPEHVYQLCTYQTFDGTHYWGPSNLLAANSIFQDSSFHAVCLFGTGHVISNNWFSSTNGWDAIRMFACNASITDNTFTNWSNLATNANHADLIQSYAVNGEVSTNVTVSRNAAYHCHDCQIGNFEDDYNSNSVANWTWENNVFAWVGAALNIAAPEFHVLNNTFHRCATNTEDVISLGYYPGEADRGCAHSAWLLNNVFSECGEDPSIAGWGWYNGNSWDDLTGVVTNFNLVIGTGAGTTKTGFSEANGINGESPLFVNVDVVGGFRLQVGSPCINAATNLSSYFTTDITGKTRTGDWDIGAYEYGRLLRTTTLRAGNVTGP